MVAKYDTVRATTRVPASLQVTMSCGGVPATGLCIDLSAGGLGLCADLLPEHGDTVALRILMPGGRVVDARAEVMYVGEAEPRRCGLRFQSLDPASLFAIHAYVAKGGDAG